MIPALYSFRRCPYAMRARLALVSAEMAVELREISLKDKPAQFLEKSASGTVPCLVLDNDAIDESFDIMLWALRQNDPENWLDMPDSGYDLIQECDGPFKMALDRTKYSNRYENICADEQREFAAQFLRKLDRQIRTWIFDQESLADNAILPFIRQFASIDRVWFDAQDWPNLRQWLDRFLASSSFAAIMFKYPLWQPDSQCVLLQKLV